MVCYHMQERYYREKLGCFTSLERRAVVDVYLAGLLWVLDYYYRGVSSWTWFYPYHYSPMCSDLVDLDSIHVEFQLGAPFLPFQQLLAVLPAASADLLPKPYKVRMTTPSCAKSIDYSSIDSRMCPDMTESVLCGCLLPLTTVFAA